MVAVPVSELLYALAASTVVFLAALALGTLLLGVQMMKLYRKFRCLPVWDRVVVSGLTAWGLYVVSLAGRLVAQ